MLPPEVVMILLPLQEKTLPGPTLPVISSA